MSMFPKVALISMLLKNIVICNVMILVLCGCKAKEHSVTNSSQIMRDTLIMNKTIRISDTIYKCDTLSQVRCITITAATEMNRNSNKIDTVEKFITPSVSEKHNSSVKWFELPIINSILLLVLIWILYKQR